MCLQIFIAHSRSVILIAHKLVYIGDAVARHLRASPAVAARTLACSNALCDAMKNTVAAAKTAAIQFPCVTAVQTMIDSFVEINYLAGNLKNAICPSS